MDLTTTTTREEWRVRTERRGQRVVHYWSTTFKSQAEAEAAIAKHKDKYPRTRLGVQWVWIEETKGSVEWVHAPEGA